MEQNALAKYDALVSEALAAFASDIEYSVEIITDARAYQARQDFFIKSIEVKAEPVRLPSELKRCPRCQEVKNREKDYYRRGGKKPHLAQSYCKICMSEIYLKKKENKLT